MNDHPSIPKDLDECFVRLKAMLSPHDVERIKRGDEHDMTQYHFGLGLWMRNNWGLWGDSPLVRWFQARGVDHADAMSGVILESFWRHLNGRPSKLDDPSE
jgi:hypothetical protein